MNMKAGGQITERLSHTVIYKHAAYYLYKKMYISHSDQITYLEEKDTNDI